MSWTLGEIFNIAAPIFDFTSFWLLLISETRKRKQRPEGNFAKGIANAFWDPELSTEKAKRITKIMYYFALFFISLGSILWLLSGILMHYNI